LAIVFSAEPAVVDYPIMSHRYLADPGSLVYDGRVYLYNSNDDDNNGSYQMHTVVCVSSADMKNWTDHGVVFQVPANASWASNSWAPQAIAKDGTIYLFFGNSGSGIGVASSTSPTGGFKDAKGSYLINGSTPGASGTDSWLFDPGALIDDDGQAYLSFGGNGVNNGRIIKLGSDLKSVSGSAVSVSTTSFFEASFLFKRNKKYYFAFSTNSSNGLRIDYHWSDSPMTGYTYGGIIAGQPPSNNNNNHASQFVYKDQWYHAYHNRYVANQAGIDATYKRNLAIEVMNFNTDGSVKQVTYTTDGVPQVGNLNPYVRVEAETMNAQSGIETETCTAGGMDVTQIANGDWVSVKGVDFGTSGATKFTARVASAAAGGSIELRLGSITGTLIGTCTVPSTGGAQTWANVTCDVTGATGVKNLYLKFTGTGTFNFDYWQFTGGDGTGGATGVGGASSTGGTSAGSTGGTRSTSGGASNSGGGSVAGGMASGGMKAQGGSFSSGSSTPTSPTTGGGQASGGTTVVVTMPSANGGANAAGGVVGQAGFTAVNTASIAGSSAVENSGASTDDGGCGCRVAHPQRAARSLAVLLLLGFAGLRTRQGARRREARRL
jgi:arabinoxylan arabinofuranohydrolase